MVDITVDSELWLRRFHPPGRDSHRLVVLPHAGGSASFFRPLAAALAPELDVLTVQYPGRQDRRSEKSIEDIGEYADRIHEVLLAEADRPTALYGHSMGAILAFEVACRLEASGHAPLAVIASGRRAPPPTARRTSTSATTRASSRSCAGSAARTRSCLATMRSCR